MGLLIFLIVFPIFLLAYFFYGSFLNNLFGVDPKRKTPAHAHYDGVDYIPAKNWLVLFGHHFSSIAGAGPIIGPVIAVMLWGWLPALIWVVVGTIFIGGVHDFGALIVSVREKGSSISDIAQHVISKRAKVLFSLFVWLALILVISVFAYLCADTFVKEAKIVLPSLGLIPVAMIVGYLLYHLNTNTFLSTILGLLCLAGLILLGNSLPISASINTWLLVLFAYCYLASVLPVNILLQPRDYLSSFLLFFGVAVGFAGLFLANPKINMPFYHRWVTPEGFLWPAMFVTVACGAISGFHALIASGTTSKQIDTEIHARRIGYGGMLAEGLVAVLAVISVAVLFNRGENFSSILKNNGPIEIFGRGYIVITHKVLGTYGKFIAVTILNAFILTTLDTATRIARYLTEELFLVKNRYISTLLIIFTSAALTLFVLSCWLIARKKTIKFTLWPALFMFITTVAALLLQMVKYFKNSDYVLFVITIFLLGLAGFMAYEVMSIIRRVNAE
jgi:carbon starvation protein